MNARAKAATIVIENAEQYKVCDQCESIARKTAAHCPICHAYRWRYEPAEVRRMAIVLGSRPPQIVSVLPRYV